MDIHKAKVDIGFPVEDIPLFEEHLKYGTCDYYITDGKYQAIVRYNISKSGRVAYILDLCCADKKYSIPAMRWFGAEGKRKFPLLQFIKFERNPKYPNREPVVYKLERLMR
jgi:hypothetical protein